MRRAPHQAPCNARLRVSSESWLAKLECVKLRLVKLIPNAGQWDMHGKRFWVLCVSMSAMSLLSFFFLFSFWFGSGTTARSAEFRHTGSHAVAAQLTHPKDWISSSHDKLSAAKNDMVSLWSSVGSDSLPLAKSKDDGPGRRPLNRKKRNKEPMMPCYGRSFCNSFILGIFCHSDRMTGWRGWRRKNKQ